MYYKNLDKTDLTPDALEDFKRHQLTEYVYYLDEKGALAIKKDPYEEFWHPEDKARVIEILKYYLDQGGAIVAAMDPNICGFAAINGRFFGKDKKQLNLGFIHVSHDYRHRGIGGQLFEAITLEAKKRGADQIYIGANPSVDTYKFYKAMGCRLAETYIPEIYDHEPRDLQLIFDLK